MYYASVFVNEKKYIPIVFQAIYFLNSSHGQVCIYHQNVCCVLNSSSPKKHCMPTGFSFALEVVVANVYKKCFVCVNFQVHTNSTNVTLICSKSLRNILSFHRKLGLSKGGSISGENGEKLFKSAAFLLQAFHGD